MKTEAEFIKYEVRYLGNGLNGNNDVVRVFQYKEIEDALEIVDKLKKNKSISKVSLFEVVEKYKKIDI